LTDKPNGYLIQEEVHRGGVGGVPPDLILYRYGRRRCHCSGPVSVADVRVWNQVLASDEARAPSREGLMRSNLRTLCKGHV
jgi:hypothetical protein